MSKLIIWFDKNLLYIAGLVLAVFIPLYPKLPLFDILPGYIVRIRVDDLLVGLAVFIWLVQLVRRRVVLPPKTLLYVFGIYLFFGFLSCWSALFWTKTVPRESLHVAKLFLHWLRRLEYFSLFFVFYSIAQDKKRRRTLLVLVLLVAGLVSVYGFGQKYLYWPSFSTMNREFSKGIRLYLTEHARVNSTFGGHYDLAAYIMLLLVLVAGVFFQTTGGKKLLLLFLFTMLFWLLILTVSRTSFVAYLVAISLLIAILSLRKGLVWAGTRWLLVIFLSIFVMLLFGDLSDRFGQVILADKVRAGITKRLSCVKDWLPEKPSGQGEFLVVSSDLPPVTQKPKRPPDVFEDIPENPVDWHPADQVFKEEVEEQLPASASADQASVSALLKPRTFSQNALDYGLSTGIRLDALWPRAWAGFKRNIWLGSGYSTVTKSQLHEFTYAESTDNDYLRLLGETGILGTVSYLAIFVVLIGYFFKAVKEIKNALSLALLASGAAFSIGLLINAFYIDVFEASKVAYTYWMLMGIISVLAVPFGRLRLRT